MADKAVSELVAASQVKPADLFVLEQDGTAKKLTGQILENWLLSFAEGHGGIQSIEKLSTNGLRDLYRITLSDTTVFDFIVMNGRGINSIAKTSSNGLVDTYAIHYNSGSSDTFTVTNGAKGDTGDAMYLWIKYASQEPTSASHSFGDIPDNWIGVYSGKSETAPADWNQYKWFQIKGSKGDVGTPAMLTNAEVRYQVSESGTVAPSGVWSESVPVVPQGKYLWTRIVQSFNTGDPITAYTVSRMGIDGLGSVASICGVSPDPDGNVHLTAEAIGARPDTWTPTAADTGAVAGLEDADSPGCYYRMVDGVQEWLNPPTVLGVEYRTAERWDNKPVYTKLVNLGAASNGKKVAHGITSTGIIRAAGKLSNIPMPVYNSENFNAEISVSDKEVKISETGYDGVLCTAQLWYVK